jgi:hypothetical protein
MNTNHHSAVSVAQYTRELEGMLLIWCSPSAKNRESKSKEFSKFVRTHV